MSLERRTPLKRSTKPLARTELKRSTKRINPRSDRKVASDKVLAAARAERMLMAGGWCEGATPACPDGRHVGVLAHHVRRRKAQPDVHDVDGLRWLCSPAHDWTHANPAAARELGLLEAIR